MNFHFYLQKRALQTYVLVTKYRTNLKQEALDRGPQNGHSGDPWGGCGSAGAAPPSPGSAHPPGPGCLHTLAPALPPAIR
jgi:hypothetical protein